MNTELKIKKHYTVRIIKNCSLKKNTILEKRNKIERKETEENKQYKYIQELLCDKLGTKVKIRGSKIEINFQDINDFNRIMEILNIHE